MGLHLGDFREKVEFFEDHVGLSVAHLSLAGHLNASSDSSYGADSTRNVISTGYRINGFSFLLTSSQVEVALGLVPDGRVPAFTFVQSFDKHVRDLDVHHRGHGVLCELRLDRVDFGLAESDHLKVLHVERLEQDQRVVKVEAEVLQNQGIKLGDVKCLQAFLEYFIDGN